MQALKHIVQQPFIAATGAAALLHSTWSLGTLFAGQQPEAALTVHFVGWLMPALLIAFAMDVGQIATSAEIRERGLTWARAVTFVVFALATYYLQWIYIAHHMPALALAAGVRESWEGAATLFRDSAVWIIPALLPLSTILYTFSGRDDHAQPNIETTTEVTISADGEMIPTSEKPLPALKAVEPRPLEVAAAHQDGNAVAAVSVSANGAGKRSQKQSGSTNGTAQNSAEAPLE